MVLAITCSFSVAESRREDVRAMLIGAICCNIAWGIVDAVMYLMAGLTARAHSLRMLRELRKANDAAEARRIVSDELLPVAGSALEPSELDQIAIRLRERPGDLPSI